MKAGRDMKCFLAAVFLALCSVTANAAFITYDVNRTIGAGTVNGFIKTDGTMGPLTKGNIVDWSITLFAPNLNEGQPYTFDITSGNTLIGGTATSATSAGLEYDFSIGGTNYFMLMSDAISIPGGTTNYFWCLETINCSAGSDLSEQIGHTIPGSSVVDQLEQYTSEDVIVFATVVPVPAAVWLFASGLLGLAGIARRKR
jgi:hypothetical protein